MKIDPEGTHGKTIIESLDFLAQHVGQVNVANDWDTSRSMVADPDGYDPRWQAAQKIAELGLIDTEVSEAIEEVRAGRGMNEVRYSKSNVSPYNERESHNPDGTPRKPEGVPSELADVIIRALDIADAYNINIGAAVVEKLNYNATRGPHHGGKAL